MKSRRYSWLLLIPLFIALAGGILYYDSYAKGTDDAFCTRFAVGSNFKPYYDSVKDHILVFGCSISEEFIDSLSNNPMQYFQRARFELVKNEKTGANEVVVTPLGELLLEPDRLVPAEDNLPLHTAACEKIANLKLNRSFYVCLDFLKFFEAHGGIAQFGYPMTSFSREGDKYVQYFEKARLEWWPGSDTEMVRLADLGTYYYEMRAKGIIEPFGQSKGNFTPGKPSELRVLAFVSKPTASSGDEQTLFVVAQVYDKTSQTWQPAQDAQVVVTLLAPNLHKPATRSSETDQDGISTVAVIINDNLEANSLVQIKIEVNYNGEPATATTWFRVWW